MSTIETVYLGCFLLGLGFALVSALLSGVFGDHVGAGADGGAGHGHVDAGSGGVHGGEALHISPVSPVIIAVFISAFGGSGLLFSKYLPQLSALVHLAASGGAGLGVAGAVFWFFYKVMAITESSSAPSADEAVGQTAEILTGIPALGTGEISYVMRESRYNACARTVDGKELPAGAAVRIVKINDGVCLVEKVK